MNEFRIWNENCVRKGLELEYRLLLTAKNEFFPSKTVLQTEKWSNKPFLGHRSSIVFSSVKLLPRGRKMATPDAHPDSRLYYLSIHISAKHVLSREI